MGIGTTIDRQVTAGRGHRSFLFRPTSGLVIRVVLSTALLATVFWLTSDTLDWRQLSVLEPLALTACAVLSGVVIWILAWRWRQVVKSLPSSGGRGLPSTCSFMRQTWLCLAVNQVLPSIVGGDTLRAMYLSKQGFPLGQAAGLVILDRTFGLVGLALLTGISAFALAPSLAAPSLLVAVGVTVGVAALAFGSRFLLADKLRMLVPANGVTWRLGLAVLGAAIVGHLANIAIFLVVAHALGAGLPLLPAIAVMCAVLLLGMLPVSVAGWGVRELALVQSFGQMGLPSDKIVLSSVVYGLVLFIGQSSAFVLFARRKRP